LYQGFLAGLAGASAVIVAAMTFYSPSWSRSAPRLLLIAERRT
jgi:hypothetical protein